IVHGRRSCASAGTRGGFRCVSSGGRGECCPSEEHLGTARGVVPHVGNGSCYASSAAGTFSYTTDTFGAVLRRLSPVVGRRATRHRKSGPRTRNLHTQRNVGGDVACSANAQ